MSKPMPLNWQTVVVAFSILAGAATFAIQIGNSQTHIDINSSVLKDHDIVLRQMTSTIATITAQLNEQNRRLKAIELHDVETRNHEAHIVERLSKVEAMVVK